MGNPMLDQAYPCVFEGMVTWVQTVNTPVWFQSDVSQRYRVRA